MNAHSPHTETKEKQILPLPGTYLWAVAGLVVGCVVLTTYTLTRQHFDGAIFGAAITLVPAFSILIAYINCRILFDEDAFIYHPPLGKATLYRYEDIYDIISENGNHRIIILGRELPISGSGTASRCFLKYAAAKSNPGAKEIGTEYIVLRDRPFPLLFGCAAIAFGLMVIVMAHQPDVTLYCSPFLLAGAFFCVYWKNSSIRFNREELIWRDPLGFEKHFPFSDFTGITNFAGADHLIFGKKKVTLDLYLSGTDMLADYIEAIAEKRQLDFAARKKDLFNGHLLHPEQTLLSIGILVLFFVGFGIYFQFFYDSVSSEYESRTVTFHEAAYDNDTIFGIEPSRLVLYGDDSEIPYLMHGFKEYGHQRKVFFKEVKNNVSFRITGYYSSEEHCFFVISCRDTSGIVFLSQEDGRKADDFILTYVILISYGMALLTLVLFSAYVLCVRNLEKCSPLMIKLILLPGPPSSNFIKKRPELFADGEGEEKESEKADGQNNENPET